AALAQTLPVADNAYRGQLLTLIDGHCFSTSGHFCALLKHHRIGTLLGSEAGGTFTCNDGSEQLHLPATRMLIHIPRRSFAAAVEDMEASHGVLPDHEVRQRYRDYLEGRDTVMEYAMRLAREQPLR
ncbi:MAG: S41 family peptidase, partial [Bacteroidota bacterium]|nr:S41 family peptidase [Bacteroidota bacterium]